MVQGRHRKAPACDGEQADSGVLELVEPAVIEREFQRRGIRPVIHRRRENDCVPLADCLSESCYVNCIVAIRVEHRQVVLAEVKQFGRRSGTFRGVECTGEGAACIALISKTTRHADEVCTYHTVSSRRCIIKLTPDVSTDIVRSLDREANLAVSAVAERLACGPPHR